MLLSPWCLLYDVRKHLFVCARSCRGGRCSIHSAHNTTMSLPHGPSGLHCCCYRCSGSRGCSTYRSSWCLLEDNYLVDNEFRDGISVNLDDVIIRVTVCVLLTEQDTTCQSSCHVVSHHKPGIHCIEPSFCCTNAFQSTSLLSTINKNAY